MGEAEVVDVVEVGLEVEEVGGEDTLVVGPEWVVKGEGRRRATSVGTETNRWYV